MKAQRSNVIVRELLQDDLHAVARVHIDAFPESTLTRLGSRVVQRFYQWQLSGPHNRVYAIGAFIDGECAGFAFSGDFNGSVAGFINQNRLLLAKEVISNPSMLFSPPVRQHLRVGLRLLSFAPRKTRAKAIRSFGVLAIAVSGGHQGRGVGKALMLHAEREALRSDYDRMHLSVNLTNKTAIKFYKTLGWRQSEEGAAWSGQMNKYLICTSSLKDKEECSLHE